MGTGSYGGGGGGGGGIGGGGVGGGGFGGGGYRFKLGKIISGVPSAKKADNETSRIFKKLNKDYILNYFCSPLIDQAYRQLFELSVHVFQNKTWQGISRRYNVPDGAGCLKRWAAEVYTRYQVDEGNQKVREVARTALDDFLILALDNNPERFYSDNSSKVIPSLKQKVFNSTSGYYLGLVLWRILEKEKESLPEATVRQLHQSAQRLADRIVNSFEVNYHAKDQVTYGDLFDVIKKNQDWLLKELRK